LRAFALFTLKSFDVALRFDIEYINEELVSKENPPPLKNFKFFLRALGEPLRFNLLTRLFGTAGGRFAFMFYVEHGLSGWNKV